MEPSNPLIPDNSEQINSPQENVQPANTLVPNQVESPNGAPTAQSSEPDDNIILSRNVLLGRLFSNKSGILSLYKNGVITLDAKSNDSFQGKVDDIKYVEISRWGSNILLFLNNNKKYIIVWEKGGGKMPMTTATSYIPDPNHPFTDEPAYVRHQKNDWLAAFKVFLPPDKLKEPGISSYNLKRLLLLIGFILSPFIIILLAIILTPKH